MPPFEPQTSFAPIASTSSVDEVAPGSPLRMRMRIMIGLIILLVLIGANLAIGFGKLRMEKVISESMDPTLKIGDTLLVDADGVPERYGIVILRDPEDAEGKLVKRIIGLPGDRIKIQSGIIYVDGQEEYSAQIAENSVNSPDMRIRVPQGHYFVMGDNRNNSVDSRDFGPVPKDHVLGTVKSIIWPPRDWGRPKAIH